MPNYVADIDNLLRDRFHGAANIRGVRCQILYAVSLALELYEQKSQCVRLRLEGLEDLDRLGLNLREGAECIQVKSSVNRWTPARLKPTLNNFFTISRSDSDCRFRLVLDGPLNGDLERLCLPATNKSEKQQQLQLWTRTCHESGLSSRESRLLAPRITLQSISEPDVTHQVARLCANAFELGSNVVDVYIATLIARFLDWSAARKTVERQDIDSIRVDVGESISRELVHEAVGRGLLQRVDWETDPQIGDFYEGKATRPGHISANADFPRRSWLNRKRPVSTV